MAPAGYIPVEADEEYSSTREQSTPETTYADDHDDDDGLEDLEAKEGYELKELDPDARPPQRGVVGGSLDKEAGHDDDEDHEGDGAANGHARRRRASVQSYELYTPDEERRVRRKLDTRLVLFVALLYLMSFLDRSSSYTLGPQQPVNLLIPTDGLQISVTQGSPA